MSQLLGSLCTARTNQFRCTSDKYFPLNAVVEVYTSNSQLAISNYVYNSKYFLTYDHERHISSNPLQTGQLPSVEIVRYRNHSQNHKTNQIKF